MKKQITLAALVLVAGYIYFAPEKKQTTVPAPAEHMHQPEVHSHAKVLTKEREPASTPAALPPARMPASIPTEQKAALESLSTILAQADHSSLTQLLEQLQKSGQQPLLARDANPDSGEMFIVRTKSPLPGTRYFHAQYFTGEDGQRFVQHMSFEFKPGPDAMEAAIATVEKTFTNLTRPKVKRPDYVKWGMDDKYIVWVKKMTAAELKDDPFNSYSLDDEGTIRVAVELEIHGD